MTVLFLLGEQGTEKNFSSWLKGEGWPDERKEGNGKNRRSPTREDGVPREKREGGPDEKNRTFCPGAMRDKKGEKPPYHLSIFWWGGRKEASITAFLDLPVVIDKKKRREQALIDRFFEREERIILYPEKGQRMSILGIRLCSGMKKGKKELISRPSSTAREKKGGGFFQKGLHAARHRCRQGKRKKENKRAISPHFL